MNDACRFIPRAKSTIKWPQQEFTMMIRSTREYNVSRCAKVSLATRRDRPNNRREGCGLRICFTATDDAREDGTGVHKTLKAEMSAATVNGFAGLIIRD